MKTIKTNKMETLKIKTIDVQAKEWFDRKNANSYFGGIITINFGEVDEFQLGMPFQYGYEDQYKHEAFKVLQSKGIIPKQENYISYWQYYEDNNIAANHSIKENCTKREVENYSTL